MPDRRPRISFESIARLVDAATYNHAFALRAFCSLRLADLLGEAPQPVRELARVGGFHEPSLTRLLRTLALHGVVAEVGPRAFGLTEAGCALRGESGEALAADVAEARAWGQLNEWVRTGRGAGLGVPPWPVIGAFDRAALPSPDAGRVVVLAPCGRSVLGGRLDLVRSPEEAGAAAALVIESALVWLDGDGARSFLRRARGVAPTVVVIEPVRGAVPDEAEAALDLRALVLTGGRLRTADEMAALVAAELPAAVVVPASVSGAWLPGSAASAAG